MHGLFEPDDLLRAIADSRTAGQRAADLIEMVVEHQTKAHAFAGAAAAMAHHVDHAVRRWLSEMVDVGAILERDGRYYGGPHYRADLLDTVAVTADRVSKALADLAEAWQAADVDSEPLLRTQLRAAYPFNDGLEQIAGKVRFWVDNVRAGADAAVNEPRACALAIRQHLRTVQPRLEKDFTEWSDNASDHTKTKYDDAGDGLSAFYEATVRNGLGGVLGDVAASASPAFLAMVADLLDGVFSNGDPELEALAERVAAAYRSSRSRDDERTY